MDEFLKAVENLRLDTTHIALAISILVGLISFGEHSNHFLFEQFIFTNIQVTIFFVAF